MTALVRYTLINRIDNLTSKQIQQIYFNPFSVNMQLHNDRDVYKLQHLLFMLYICNYTSHHIPILPTVTNTPRLIFTSIW